MLIIGAHRINHGGFDGSICQQIQNSRLLWGNGSFGHGAYAYYADRIPSTFRGDPFVIFQPLEIRTAIEVIHVHIPRLHHVGDSFFFVVRRSTADLFL